MTADILNAFARCPCCDQDGYAPKADCPPAARHPRRKCLACDGRAYLPVNHILIALGNGCPEIKETVTCLTTTKARAMADQLRDQEGGCNAALEYALDKTDQAEDAAFWFWHSVADLCHHRANQEQEGFDLVEIVEK